MKRFAFYSALPALVLCSHLPARGQQPPPRDAGRQSEELEVRVYRVTDLVLPTPSHAYEGIQVPGRLFGSGIGGGGMGGAGGGGAGGGAGGGFFSVDDQLAQAGGQGRRGGTSGAAMGQGMGGMGGGVGGGMGGMGGGMGSMMGGRPRMASQGGGFEVNDLIQAITKTIAFTSWDEVGGPGSIVALRGMLIVNQTPAVHRQIEDLLDAMRSEGGALRTVTIQAQWLLLETRQLEQLLGEAEAGGPRAVDARALEQVAAEAKVYQGEVTCFDGQTVHIVSGRMRTVVQSVIPVVGEGGPGYQPVLANVHVGALLEVTPTAVGKNESLVVDLKSYVTRTGEPDQQIDFPGAPAIDRMNLVVHQFATTLRLQPGQPVIAGGLTLASSPQANGAAEAEAAPVEAAGPQLYLVISATVADPPERADQTDDAEPHQPRPRRR